MSLDTVLVANRGEIACRLIRAVQAEGLRSVAVFSRADRGAPHTRLADLAVPIGPGPAVESYLDGARIITAAKKSGAQAIHPGYGFLAENADFAEKCRAAGLIFVGPSPVNIRLMGSKIAAKAAAVSADVPVVPGYFGKDQSDDVLLAEARKIGTPLMIKASAGGGGRGMRRVDDLAHFLPDLAAARAEAQAAFGSDTVLLERFVSAARHVEVQILGDGRGNTIHLWERDCSLQRNHQKIIEEAPAPYLPTPAREAMLSDAVRLTAAIGYEGAGTIEFLYDVERNAYYFLEMNTRLQVEHPVTEAITGIDIARWQLRIAMGEALDLSQDAIPCTGWAIEARISAEDPAEGYRPQTGRITAWAPPALEGLRLDSGVEAGSEVTHHYDSMLAKLIAHGESREAARRLLLKGLEGMAVAGIGTNLDFLVDLARLPDFAEGRHDTATIAQRWPEGWRAASPAPRQFVEAVLARFLSEAPQDSTNPWTALGAWRVLEAVGHPGQAIYYLNDEPVSLSGRGGDYRVSLPEGDTFAFSHAQLDDGWLNFEQDGLYHRTRVALDGARVTLQEGGRHHVIEVATGTKMLARRQKGGGEAGEHVYAPMPGLVVELLAGQGDRVAAGDPVVVIEAMKLMQTLTAPRDGVIESIPCAPGDNVETGALLAAIAPTDDDDEQGRQT